MQRVVCFTLCFTVQCSMFMSPNYHWNYEVQMKIKVWPCWSVHSMSRCSSLLRNLKYIVPYCQVRMSGSAQWSRHCDEARSRKPESVLPWLTMSDLGSTTGLYSNSITGNACEGRKERQVVKEIGKES